MDPEKAFEQVMSVLRRDPRVGEAKMFGARGAKVGEKYFAMLYKGQLVVKLPAERAGGLVASGDGSRFDPGHGRPMKEWITFAPDRGTRWSRLAEEAKEFVASLPVGKARPGPGGSRITRTVRAAKAKTRQPRRSGL